MKHQDEEDYQGTKPNSKIKVDENNLRITS
jgi:hypothetical protein